MNNTLTSFVDFCKSVGRGAYEVWGDSTVQRSGGGHDEHFGKGLAGLVQCAGQMIPCNTTSIFNDTAGGIAARRRNNASTRCGTVNDVGVDANGYPVTMKQYGVQIPVPGAIAGATTWSGAQVAFLAGATVNMVGGVLIAGDVVLTDASNLNPAANSRVKIDNEVIKYGSIVANTLTGCTRGDLSTVAATHVDGSVVGQCDNGPAISGMVQMSANPIGSGGIYKASLWYMSVTASAVPCAQVTMEILQQDILSNSAAGATTKNGVASWGGASTGLAFDAAPQVLATQAVGTIGVLDSPATASSDNTTTVKFATLAFGSAQNRGNGLGPSGPAAYMMLGVFEQSRDVGMVQSCGVSKGSKTYNQLLKQLRAYDVANAVCEYDAGVVSRMKLYIDATFGIGGSGRGGNGVGGYCKVIATGSNEVSGSTTETALVDPTEPWTIARTKVLGGGGIDSSSTAAITLDTVTGIPTTGGHVLIESERIIYTGVSGSTITGITRGAYGTVPAAHADTTAVYQGYNIQDPLGLASELLFDYKLTTAHWATAGGAATRLWYVWVRPIPQSATSTAVADASAATTAAEREYKFTRYRDTVQQYLGGRLGFVLADTSKVFTAGESVADDLGVSTVDQIHMSDATYALCWHRMFTYDQVALASINPPRGRGN